MSQFHDDPVIDARLRVCAAIETAMHAPHDGDFAEMRTAVDEINEAMRSVNKLESGRTITLTRPERDLIHQNLIHWMYLSDPVPFGDHAEATETIEKLQRLRAFYDELGWEDDDPREVFVLTVDDVVLEVLRGAAESASKDIACEVHYRETHVLGLRPTRSGTTWADDYPTIEDANRDIDHKIRVAEEERRLADALLARLDAEAVTA